MPISRIDYENAAEEPVEQAVPEPVETPATKAAPFDFTPWISAAGEASAAIADLVKQTTKLQEWNPAPAVPQKAAASLENPSQPPGEVPEAPPNELPPGAAGEPVETPAPDDAAGPVPVTLPDENPTAGQTAARLPEEKTTTPPRIFSSRLGAAQSRITVPATDNGELEDLLEHAISLLESVSLHPALRDFTVNKQKLDEIEQRLGYGAYPQ